MRLLIDANIFLEALLNQQEASSVRTFLLNCDTHEIFISDFSLHAIAIILQRRGFIPLLRKFFSDTIWSSNVEVLTVTPPDLSTVLENVERYRLDFDDAYQYTLAEQYGMVIVSFDHHFDHTPFGRMTPAQFL